MHPFPLLAFACIACACASAPPRAFPASGPLWHDPDRRPFAGKPEKYSPPHYWDRLDQSVFRPVSQFFAVSPGGKARNVNAWDEVPDSSWFENRIGTGRLSTEQSAFGPCEPPLLTGNEPWKIIAGKPGGAHPGFLIEAPDERRYLIKVDGSQAPRATLAEVVASRIYHAAGFRVPCNSIVTFDRSTLHIDPEATADNEIGDEVPLTWAHVDHALESALRTEGGRYRAVASLFLDGKPIGPWRYYGTRDDDRNDVVPHEDRRELRGSRLLAAWTDHADQREENTLSMWMEQNDGSGFVVHHLLDFGDCFGSYWGRDVAATRRRGHAYWLDVEDVAVDFLSLGMVERPWDRAELGRFGLTLGYYGIIDFDPETWVPDYPNPAFGRMTEHDAAWMARIIARMDEPVIEGMLMQAEIDRELRDGLSLILQLRRQRILKRYLTRLSPLADPEVYQDANGTTLCAEDLAVRVGVAPSGRRYRAEWSRVPEFRDPKPAEVVLSAPGRPCARIQRLAGATPETPEYVVIQISVEESSPLPIRHHLYDRGTSPPLLAAIERIESDDGTRRKMTVPTPRSPRGRAPSSPARRDDP